MHAGGSVGKAAVRVAVCVCVAQWERELPLRDRVAALEGCAGWREGSCAGSREAGACPALR